MSYPTLLLCWLPLSHPSVVNHYILPTLSYLTSTSLLPYSLHPYFANCSLPYPNLPTLPYPNLPRTPNPTPPCSTLHYSTVPPLLPCLILSYCPSLHSYPTLPYHTLTYPAFPYPFNPSLPYPNLPYPTLIYLHYPTLHYPAPLVPSSP